ncbi:hypothetical protein LTR66_015231, partial [Elasticomyces elasticus]
GAGAEGGVQGEGAGAADPRPGRRRIGDGGASGGESCGAGGGHGGEEEGGWGRGGADEEVSRAREEEV